MKFSLFGFFGLALFSFVLSHGEDQPTLAEPSTQTETQSVLANKSAPAISVDDRPQNCSYVSLDKKILYKRKRNIAPCAVQQGLELSYCETKVDACCNRTSTLEKVDVPACIPPCNESVKVLKSGNKTVYDYGRYEVILKARDNDTIEVNYRKRLFNR